ncbi:VanW family protein [uncultured Tessaracoccus sp.]|uniref:VanW family protein n=1 Tax=uncultured Tessaracoccus sp. TaxID=905023 RepID=UPI002611CFE1|nr:VanW family protein [uncultured Tessaracoccus sp.]
MAENTKSNTKLWTGIGIGAFVVLLAAAYVTAYLVAGDQVPPKASVENVAIGGLSPADAQQKLRDELAESAEAPISLAHNDVTVELPLAESGLSIDWAATVGQAGGGASWNPVILYRSLTGGHPVELVRTIDEEALAKAVSDAAPRFDKEATDATIGLKDGEVATTEAQEGIKLKVDESITAVKEAFQAGKHEAAADVEVIAPGVSDGDVQSFRDGALKQALTGPISLTSKNGTIDIAEADVPKLLTLTGSGKDLAVGIDEQAVKKATEAGLKKLNQNGPRSASYQFKDGGIAVVPSRPGLVVEQKSVVEAFKQAVTGPKRTVELKAQEKEPEFSTAAAEKVKPKEVIGEFTTLYPHASYRNTNIGTAAKRINGSVLLPGETFSMNDTVGERTASNGFTAGYVINSGNLVRETGGGVSQAATTLFNAGFFAGFEDVEHKPHSLYFPRYPAGREATVYYGSVDLRFKNNTKYPAIIQGYINPSSSGKPGSVTFKVWSIKTWDKVESSPLVKSEYYSGSTRVSHAANCEPQGSIQGFTVNYKRLFYKGGKVVKEEPFSWKYDAGDRITCA